MKRRRGSNAIEFAFTIPILLLFLVGITEYGFFYVRESTFRHSLHLAARTAAGTPMDSDPEARFASELQTRLEAQHFDPDVVDSTVSVVGDAGDRFLHVTASMPWDGLTGLPIHPTVLGGAYLVRMEDQEP